MVSFKRERDLQTNDCLLILKEEKYILERDIECPLSDLISDINSNAFIYDLLLENMEEYTKN